MVIQNGLLVYYSRCGLSLQGERLCDIQVIFSQTQPLGLCHDNQLWLDTTPGVIDVNYVNVNAFYFYFTPILVEIDVKDNFYVLPCSYSQKG